MWWDLIPDADCLGLERDHCSVDAAPGGCVMAMFLMVLIGPVEVHVMLINLIMLFNIL